MTTMRTQLHHLLEEGAVRFGDRPALSHQDVTLDYASAWDLASRTGAVLSGLGVARGDRVAVYLDKRPETVGGIFGASVAGGVFVPVNPALKGSQVAYILGDCDVRVLITTRQRWESVREDAKG
jgi:acyl-CoA synthetase (AMP-forming)/AMP-acid ligase II